MMKNRIDSSDQRKQKFSFTCRKKRFHERSGEIYPNGVEEESQRATPLETCWDGFLHPERAEEWMGVGLLFRPFRADSFRFFHSQGRCPLAVFSYPVGVLNNNNLL